MTKKDILELNKIKNFCTASDSIKKMKKQHTEYE